VSALKAVSMMNSANLRDFITEDPSHLIAHQDNWILVKVGLTQRVMLSQEDSEAPRLNMPLLI
jgi:hypothetical protein